MSSNAKILAAVAVVTLLLVVYVAPQWVNRIPGIHVPTVPFRLGLDLLGGAHLEYQADFSGLQNADKAQAMQGIRDVVERRINYFGVAEPLVQVSGTDRLIVEIAGVTDVNQAIQLIGETPYLEFKEQNAKGEWVSTGLTGQGVSKASVTFSSQTSQPQVSLVLTSEGAKQFADITKRNLGKPVAIYLDGAPISIPTVQSEITDGNAVITGSFTPTEARQLATRLNSGALPVPIKLLSQQTIGASLGAKSLHDSLLAGLWGLILVGVFMIAFYRLPGLVAVVALLVYTVIVLAIYKFLPVTLTLAGIAGFILSLGMAVDANILIFARMREELRSGKPLTAAMHEGFRRAWLPIRDSHVTSLIGAVILYLFTTSIVKGFALTLGIGVLTSLFTATTVTRSILYLFIGPRSERMRFLFG